MRAGTLTLSLLLWCCSLLPLSAETPRLSEWRVQDLSLSYSGEEIVVIVSPLDDSNIARVFRGASGFDEAFEEITLPEGWRAWQVDHDPRNGGIVYAATCRDEVVCGERFEDWVIFDHRNPDQGFVEVTGGLPGILYHNPLITFEGDLYYTMTEACGGARVSYNLAICNSVIAQADSDAADEIIFPEEVEHRHSDRLGHYALFTRSILLRGAEMFGFGPSGEMIPRTRFSPTGQCDGGYLQAESPRLRALNCMLREERDTSSNRLTFIHDDRIEFGLEVEDGVEDPFVISERTPADRFQAPITSAELFRDGDAILIYQNTFGPLIVWAEGGLAYLMFPENGFPQGRQSPYALTIDNSGSLLAFARGLSIGTTTDDLSGIVLVHDFTRSEVLREMHVRPR
ncbi:MAG: hypothetical protein ACPGID_08220 [Rubricella sp.]